MEKKFNTRTGINMNHVVGKRDMLFITFDTLRYDVAVEEFENGGTPNLREVLPFGWEKRHSPGNFTWASHHSFFAGFLPTPATPGPHERLFAASFAGSESTGENTWEFDSSDLVTALRKAGYHTACIGGVGFFNKRSPVASVFPDLFDESYWSESTGVTDPKSTENQVDIAIDIIERQNSRDNRKPLFLFINISALHQPNCFYLDGEERDSKRTHAAALRYVDSCLPKLFSALKKRGNPFTILTSDHGTLYGEDGYTGHRISHEIVWTVPFAAFLMDERK